MSVGPTQEFADRLDAGRMLLTFTQVRGAVYGRAVDAALDRSAALALPVTDSAIGIGKMLNDPAAGVGRHGRGGRAGVTFTAYERAQIDAMVKAGDRHGAQCLILDVLDGQFGGAYAATRTYRRPVERPAYTLPRHIEVAPRVGLIIDGRLLPHPVGIDFTVHGAPDEMPGVTVFLPAECVSVNGRLEAGTPSKPYRPGPFCQLNVAVERERLADLGRRIAATRKRALG